MSNFFAIVFNKLIHHNLTEDLMTQQRRHLLAAIALSPLLFASTCQLTTQQQLAIQNAANTAAQDSAWAAMNVTVAPGCLAGGPIALTVQHGWGNKVKILMNGTTQLTQIMPGSNTPPPNFTVLSSKNAPGFVGPNADGTPNSGQIHNQEIDTVLVNAPISCTANGSATAMTTLQISDVSANPESPPAAQSVTVKQVAPLVFFPSSFPASNFPPVTWWNGICGCTGPGSPGTFVGVGYVVGCAGLQRAPSFSPSAPFIPNPEINWATAAPGTAVQPFNGAVGVNNSKGPPNCNLAGTCDVLFMFSYNLNQATMSFQAQDGCGTWQTSQSIPVAPQVSCCN